MRTIKFRGRVHKTDPLDAGKIVYGSFVDYGENFYQYRYWIYPTDGDRNFPVDEKSIAQLVGYDKNGEEIYEGDRLCNPRDGTRFKASMNHIYTVKIYEKEASTNA